MQVTPYLVAYFNQQDRAKQLTTPGFMVRELASYHHTQQQQITKELVVGAVRVGALKGIRKQIGRLLKKAEKSQGDDLRRIGAEIERLYQQAEDLSGTIS